LRSTEALSTAVNPTNINNATNCNQMIKVYRLPISCGTLGYKTPKSWTL
jgi:hypothetical protein